MPHASGDPTRPFRSIPDPATRLVVARRAQRLAEARNVSRRYVLLATGLALLPLPLVDVAAVLALQVKLVQDLAHLYAVPFESGMVKPLLASFLSGGAVSGGGLLLMGLGLTIPGLGTLVGGGFAGSLAGTTLATSEIFIRHFEAGGTLLDFDPKIAQLPPATSLPVPSSSPRVGEEVPSPPPPAVAAETQNSPQESPIEADPKPTDQPGSDLARIYGIGAIYRDRLFASGIMDFASLASLQPEALKAILGQRVSTATARDFIAQAKSLAQMNSS